MFIREETQDIPHLEVQSFSIFTSLFHRPIRSAASVSHSPLLFLPPLFSHRLLHPLHLDCVMQSSNAGGYVFALGICAPVCEGYGGGFMQDLFYMWREFVVLGKKPFFMSAGLLLFAWLSFCSSPSLSFSLFGYSLQWNLMKLHTRSLEICL
jgi:hypothetical protein